MRLLGFGFWMVFVYCGDALGLPAGATETYKDLLIWAEKNHSLHYVARKTSWKSVDSQAVAPGANLLSLVDNQSNEFYFRYETRDPTPNSEEMLSFIARISELPRLDANGWQGVIRSLDQETRVSLFLKSLETSWKVASPDLDEFRNFPEEIQGMLSRLAEDEYLSPLHYLVQRLGFPRRWKPEPKDFTLLAESVSNSITFEKVVYDNRSSTHIYHDKSLELQINALRSLLFGLSEIERESLLRESPEAILLLTKNTHSLFPSSRIELSDLISKMEAQEALRKIPNATRFDIPPLVLAEFSRDKLEALAHPELAAAFEVFRDVDGSNNLLFLCGSKTSEIEAAGSEDVLGFRSISEGSSILIQNWREVTKDQGSTRFRWTCGTATHELELSIKETPQILEVIDPPVTKAIEAEHLNILVSFAMREVLSPAMIKIFMAELSRRAGLSLVSDFESVEDFDSAFDTDFIESDIYFPVAHYLRGNSLRISSHRQNIRAVYSREVEREGANPVQLKVVFYFPELLAEAIDQQAVYRSVGELSELLAERRAQAKEPLVSMIMSCFSEASVFMWMNAQKKSFEAEADCPPIQPIYAIASETGFDSSIEGIIFNFAYAIDMVETLVRTRDLQKLEEVLNENPGGRASFEGVFSWSRDVRETWARNASLDISITKGGSSTVLHY